MDKNLKREIILDNYQNPFHKKNELNTPLVLYRSNNPSCIDDIIIGFLINNEIIEDAYFMGEACAISTSVTSVMLKLIIGKTLEEVRVLTNNYLSMIDEKEYDIDMLKELNAYDEIYLQPNRKTCAILPFKALDKALQERGV